MFQVSASPWHSCRPHGSRVQHAGVPTLIAQQRLRLDWKPPAALSGSASIVTTHESMDHTLHILAPPVGSSVTSVLGAVGLAT